MNADIGHSAFGEHKGSYDATAPWRITADADEWSATHDAFGTSCYCGIRNADGTVVALAVAQSSDYGDDPDCRPIAERIAQCVNAHDDMLAALRQAEKWIVQQMLDNGCPAERLEQPPAGSHLFNIRAAIAKATGEAA